ncbi:MAG: chemotaxis protein CheX [Bdellovibrionales bacterium]|nr:chemotaxis protein CheX [Bdellovibrionales bacterium]
MNIEGAIAAEQLAQECRRVADELGTAYFGTGVVTRPLERAADTFGSAVDSRAAAVEVSGAWRGQVAVLASRPWLTIVASCLFHLPEADITELHREEVILEMTNICGGNLKTVLPEPCELSVPRLLAPADYAMISHSRYLHGFTMTYDAATAMPFIICAAPHGDDAERGICC